MMIYLYKRFMCNSDHHSYLISIDHLPKIFLFFSFLIFLNINSNQDMIYDRNNILMNHIITLNNKHYIIRQEQQKIILLSFPDLKILHKCYINNTFTTVNVEDKEIMALFQNQVSILKVVVSPPLQIIVDCQSFVDWEPLGGILMQQIVVLYGLHGIMFYTKGKILEKTWEVEVLQDIEQVKGSPGDQSIAMKVKQPNNSLFLWNMLEPSVKPSQQIILSQPIVQWEFISKTLLAIQTASQLRIYIKDNQNQFNLYHFYLIAGKDFCWVDYPCIARENRLSVNSVIVMQPRGRIKILQLFGVERRVLQSEMSVIGQSILRYKTVNMKRVIGCWKENDTIALACQTKNHSLFAVELGRGLQVSKINAYQEFLGAHINEAYASGNLILVRDKTRWKYYRLTGGGTYQHLDEVDCEKAFIGSQKEFFYLHDQSLTIKQVGGQKSEPIPFKYPNASKIHYLHSDEENCFLIAGIRFYRISNGQISPAGFSMRSDRAQLVSVDRMSQILTYKMGNQKMLLTYKMTGQKMSAAISKSSQKDVIGIKGGRWIQLYLNEIVLGQGDKKLATFQLSTLLKLLDSENKTIEYKVHEINGNGLVLMMKNYAFFLQIVEDEKGCQIVLIKRKDTVLYHRFNPHAHTIQLIDPFHLTFWTGNKVISLGQKIHPHAIVDPYSPPQTLMSKQLELKRVFSPHHPRFIQLLIETNHITLTLEVLKIIQKWFFKQGHRIQHLYEELTVDRVSNIMERNREEDLSRWGQNQKQIQEQFLKEFGEQIKKNVDDLQLAEQSSINFQSMIQSLSECIRDSKLVDIFSQSSIILAKSELMKGKQFTSMNIAHLLHSLNKQQAAGKLKPEKPSWQWLKNNSVPFWINNKDMLKKWIEEIAMQQYRNKKEPFDCLFWYILVGKQSLIAKLFQTHKLDSKQHQAIANFLQRDFEEPKNRSAATKNAYVLIDKKRYLHAMAFFIMGQGIQDCVRLSIDRIKDLNLAYTFLLLFKDTKSQYFYSELQKGDIWMKHVANKLSGKHIQSYNCIFEESSQTVWDYEPPLMGFHPSAVDFSQKVKNSVAVRRQLDQQNQVNNASQDIFADFYGSSSTTVEQQKKQRVELMGDVEQLKKHSVEYYMKEGVPLIGLTLDKSNKQANEAYAFELYKLGGDVQPSMQSVVQLLQDRPSLVKCFISNSKIHQLVDFLRNQIERFKNIMSQVYMLEIIKTKKYVVGDLLHFAYSADKIAQILAEQEDNGNVDGQVRKLGKEMEQLSIVALITSCLILEQYENILPCLQKLNNKNPSISELWQILKEKYTSMPENIKSKQLKQMDYFEHAFIESYRAINKEDVYRSDLEITVEEGIKMMVKICVMRYLTLKEHPFCQSINNMRFRIEEYLNNWLPASRAADLKDEFRLFLREGTQAKLKLPLLAQVFGKIFNQIFDLLKVVHGSFFTENSITPKQQKTGQLQAIQVFRNKQDGVRSFILNKHEGKGMECIVLFKRLLKKFELCQNIAKRQRTRDGFGLLGQDSGYTNISHVDPISYLRERNLAPIQDALQHITSERKNYNQRGFPRACTNFSEQSYVRQVEVPYLDYNQLNSIECHPYLPFFLIGGKGLVEVAHLSSLKNFDRVKCPGMSQIVRLHSCGQRMGVVDNSGSFSIYNFDPSFTNNCVYSVKKSSIINFCYFNPSVVAMVSSNSLHVVDTLIHPKRQIKFKHTFNKDPLSLATVGDNRIVVLRKHDALIYDIRNEKLQGTREFKGKGAKSIYVENDLIYVGMSDSKIKVFDSYGSGDTSVNIRVGSGDQKEREKIGVEQITGHDTINVAMNSDGSIFYLPRVDPDLLRN